MSRAGTFRVAVRKFGPFESAIAKQWASFEAAAATGLQLEAVPMDLHPLAESLFDRDGLRNGDWDVAFLNTDWVEACARAGLVSDLASRLRCEPPEDYPDGWTPSLLRLQEVDGVVLGLPYHDGPECLIYRTDLFEDAAAQSAFAARYRHSAAAARNLERVPAGWRSFSIVPRGAFTGRYSRPIQTATTACTISACSSGRAEGSCSIRPGRLRLDTPAAAEGARFLPRHGEGHDVHAPAGA